MPDSPDNAALQAKLDKAVKALEIAQKALDRSRCIIKYHVKDAGVCCTMGDELFSALDAYNGNVTAYNEICDVLPTLKELTND
jgi:hypothetical protein